MKGMTTANPGPQPRERLAHKWKVLIAVVFGIFMVILDTTVVNVAFQTLRREYGASLADAQWIISVYVLALGIATPLAGFLSDRFGIKRVYVAGLCTFVAGSLLCGISPSLWVLVAARALQGFGGGIALPLGTATLLRTFPVEEQGRALGFFGIALVVAPALGPILGGYLVDVDRWRWIFFINVPIGILGIYLNLRFQRDSRHRPGGALDWPGLVTEVVGFGSILYGASIAERNGWTSPTTLFWFALGAAGLAAFVLIELFVAKNPLLDFRLFRQRTFTLSSLVGYASVLGLFGAEFLLPVYLQALRGKTALETGFILLPMAFAAGIATPVAGRIYDRVGPRPLLVTGFSLLMVNTWQLSQLTAATSVRWLLFLLLLRGLALGMTVQTTFITALSVVPAKDLPRGSSLVNSLRQVVQSLGVAMLATVLASTQSPQVRAFQQRYQESAPAASQGQRFALCGAPLSTAIVAPGGMAVESAPGQEAAPRSADGSAPSPAGHAPSAAGVPPQAAGMLREACAQSVRGFERAYLVTLYMATLALLLGAMLPGWPGEWRGRTSHATTPHIPEPVGAD
jgi:EmrB/QacA subfamily drug resistance transporter